MKDRVNQFLQHSYHQAMALSSGKSSPLSTLPQAVQDHLQMIVNHAENNKGVITVVFTSLVYKCLHPEQDIRKHQSGIIGGYSGRTFDTAYITPFLKAHHFPAMAESGWLTRSLEHKVAYDKNYTGAIKPAVLKEAFLDVMADVEEDGGDAEDMLAFLLQGLIIQRDKNMIQLAIPRNLSIDEMVSLLDQHFHAGYTAFGASRLPVLALYAMYQSLFDNDIKRYKEKRLLPLESHTSADTRSGRIGDIDIVNLDNTPFESVEVKLDIPVSIGIVLTAKEKLQPTKVERYYILSTSKMKGEDMETITKEIRQIKNTHGCQLIVNGVLPTIKYHLRLLENTVTFIDYYLQLLQIDKAIKFEHKQKWNELVSQI